jgi:hypothetical protein
MMDAATTKFVSLFDCRVFFWQQFLQNVGNVEGTSYQIKSIIRI